MTTDVDTKPEIPPELKNDCIDFFIHQKCALQLKGSGCSKSHKKHLRGLIFGELGPPDYDHCKHLIEYLMKYNKTYCDDSTLIGRYADLLHNGYNDFEKAERYYLKSIELSNFTNYISTMNYAIMLKTDFLFTKESLPYYLQSLKNSPNKAIESVCWNNFGGAVSTMFQNKLAIECFKRVKFQPLQVYSFSLFLLLDQSLRVTTIFT